LREVSIQRELPAPGGRRSGDGSQALGEGVLEVGEQDLTRLAGHRQSSKMSTAAGLAASGHDIEIIDESDFYRMLAT
jgi:hypothetical protein